MVRIKTEVWKYPILRKKFHIFCRIFWLRLKAGKDSAKEYGKAFDKPKVEAKLYLKNYN